MLSAALDKLCELVEFRDQGLTVVDAFEGDEQRIAFRTVVQISGDIMVMVDPEIVAHPQFDALHQAHAAHVREVLSSHVKRLRRWLNGVTWVGVGGFAVLGGTLSSTMGVSELLLGEAQQLVHAAAAAVLGGVAWPLGGKLLGVLMRRRLGAQSQLGAQLGDLLSRKSR